MINPMINKKLSVFEHFGRVHLFTPCAMGQESLPLAVGRPWHIYCPALAAWQTVAHVGRN